MQVTIVCSNVLNLITFLSLFCFLFSYKEALAQNDEGMELNQEEQNWCLNYCALCCLIKSRRESRVKSCFLLPVQHQDGEGALEWGRWGWESQTGNTLVHS